MSGKIEYVAFADQNSKHDWRVEGVNEPTKEVYITIFSGNNAEARAVEYAALKNGTHQFFEAIKRAKAIIADKEAQAISSVPEPEPTLVSGVEEFTVYDTRNRNFVLVRPRLGKWTFDKHRGKLLMVPLPAIERLGEGVTKGKK
jgi:hypothetical protein